MIPPMKLIATILLCLLMLPHIVHSQTVEEELLHDILEENSTKEAETLSDEEPLEQNELSEVEVEEEPEKWAMTMDIAVGLTYVFSETGESFSIKYNMNFKATFDKPLQIIKGKAKISARPEGYLAKWPTGECKLGISIANIPYEIIFSKPEEEDVCTIKLNFKKKILETWRSTCIFTDAPGAKFETTGPPEKWLETILKDMSPPLNRITAELSPDTPTTVMLTIAPMDINDPPIGSANVEGTGIVTLKPAH